MLIGVFIIQGILAIFFLVSALMKLFAHKHMIEEFEKFDYPYWIARLAGLIELAAAPLLLLGFQYHFLASLGGWMLVPVMIGASYTNFTKRPAAFGWGTIVILVLCLIPALTFLPALLDTASQFLPIPW